jgi:hypothetical protein
MWLDKEIQIAMNTMLDMQDMAYQHFLATYKTQALALKHTKIFMDAVMLMVNQNGGNKQC